MIFSYNWLQEYVKEKLPRPQKLGEVLSFHAFEVEEVRKKNNDFILDIDITSNRVSDCSSHLGIARECCALLGFHLKVPDFGFKGKAMGKTGLKIEVEDKNACPRYTARVIKGTKVTASPSWLKKRLEICGLQSINNIVDIVNYVMLEIGQPLHVFDYNELKEATIRVRSAKKGETITSLDGQRFDLDKDVLIIADAKEPIAIAGIKGGEGPGVSDKTKAVVLESANFDSIIVRKASQKLKLRTDASWRFEHGIDPNLTEVGINRTTSLIKELAGAEAVSCLIDYYPQKRRSKIVKLDYDKIERLLGLKISQKEIIKIFERLEFKILKDSDVGLEVKIPTWRLDISIPEDLIEEIGRVYGYDKIQAIAPKAALIPPTRNLEIFWEEFSKDVLKESGFSEVYNYSFISQKRANLFNYKSSDLLEIENPLSENQRYLVPSLIPNILENTKENFKHFNSFKIFELGKTYCEKRDKEKIESPVSERRKLVGVIAHKREKDIFYQLKGVIDFLLEKMAISDIWYNDFQLQPDGKNLSVWDIQRLAEIRTGDKKIGFLGYPSSKILKSLKLEGTIVMFDIDFDLLQTLASEEHEYQVISPYPSATRDLAILVPFSVNVVDVLNIINREGGKLVRDVDLFDIYKGEELPEGKKNLAFHIVYQAEDRTLDSREIKQLQQKIIKGIEQNPGWEVRKK